MVDISGRASAGPESPLEGPAVINKDTGIPWERPQIQRSPPLRAEDKDQTIRYWCGAS